MTRRAQENLVAVLILGIFVAAIIASMGYGPRARLVPIPIAAIGAILIIGQLVVQNLRSEKALEIDLLEFISRRATGDHDDVGAPAGVGAGTTPPDSAGAERRLTWRRELAALGVVVLIVALFFLIGPLPAMFLFTAGYFALSRHYSLLRSVLYAFGYTAAVYALFYLWLGVDMRQGVFDLGFGLW